MIFRSIPQWYMGNRIRIRYAVQSESGGGYSYNPLSHHTSLCSSPLFFLATAMQAVISRMTAASAEEETAVWKTAAPPSGITGEPWELEGALTALSDVFWDIVFTEGRKC